MDLSVYSEFGGYFGLNEYRQALCRAAGWGELNEYDGYGGEKQFPSDPLTAFLDHPDHEGSIPSVIAGLLAERLEGLQIALSTTSFWGTNDKFISLLRKAASTNEDVRFT